MLARRLARYRLTGLAAAALVRGFRRLGKLSLTLTVSVATAFSTMETALQTSSVTCCSGPQPVDWQHCELPATRFYRRSDNRVLAAVLATLGYQMSGCASRQDYDYQEVTRRCSARASAVQMGCICSLLDPCNRLELLRRCVTIRHQNVRRISLGTVLMDGNLDGAESALEAKCHAPLTSRRIRAVNCAGSGAGRASSKQCFYLLLHCDARRPFATRLATKQTARSVDFEVLKKGGDEDANKGAEQREGAGCAGSRERWPFELQLSARLRQASHDAAVASGSADGACVMAGSGAKKSRAGHRCARLGSRGRRRTALQCARCGLEKS
eukprot:IDg21704t1